MGATEASFFVHTYMFAGDTSHNEAGLPAPVQTPNSSSLFCILSPQGVPLLHVQPEACFTETGRRFDIVTIRPRFFGGVLN